MRTEAFARCVPQTGMAYFRAIRGMCERPFAHTGYRRSHLPRTPVRTRARTVPLCDNTLHYIEFRTRPILYGHVGKRMENILAIWLVNMRRQVAGRKSEYFHSVSRFRHPVCVLFGKTIGAGSCTLAIFPENYGSAA